MHLLTVTSFLGGRLESGQVSWRKEPWCPHWLCDFLSTRGDLIGITMALSVTITLRLREALLTLLGKGQHGAML